MCNQSTWSNLWNCIRRTYLTIKNHQRKFYKILTSWRIQDTKTKLDDKKQCFYVPVKFLVTHEYKKPKRWHANMYMISQKNYNHLFATKHMWKAGKIKEITYPRKGMCVCKHLFITYPAVFSKIEYTLCCYILDNYMQKLGSFIFKWKWNCAFFQAWLSQCSEPTRLFDAAHRLLYAKQCESGKVFPIYFTYFRTHWNEVMCRVLL